MTAVANLPGLQQNNRSRWSISGGQVTFDTLNADEVARKFMSRKSAPRSNSTPSVSSSNSSSISYAATIQPKSEPNVTQMSSATDSDLWASAGTKKVNQKSAPWPPKKSKSTSNFKASSIRSSLNSAPNDTAVQPQDDVQSNRLLSLALNSQPSAPISSQHPNGNRPTAPGTSENTPMLFLFSTNGTFDRKTISVPVYPDSLRIGRQTNTKTVPTPTNGYFDSKVLSRQHAEIWADKQGKIWIRDIKSSNGTFVNGVRLSAENRDSEPHELETQDHLELGIDIVSEDQKTVVHHKVAAKVEYAGYFGAEFNFVETMFGDFDRPTGVGMGPSQGRVQARGRTESNFTTINNNRTGTPASMANNQMNLNQHRLMNFWLAPVTMEEIVGKLTREMRVAKLQTIDLGRANDFLGSILSDDQLVYSDKPPANEAIRSSVFQNNAVRPDSNSRFSAPLAPPPQQPLPEKPDFARSANPQSQSYSKRKSIERPKSISNISPVCPEIPVHITTLIDNLATAKKEIEAQSAKLYDLQELLKKEKHARELAEEAAKRVESRIDTNPKGFLTVGIERLVMEEAFEPCLGLSNSNGYIESEVKSQIPNTTLEPAMDLNPTNSKGDCEESLPPYVQESSDQLKALNSHIKTHEREPDADQKTLLGIPEVIKWGEAEQKASLRDKSGSQGNKIEVLNENFKELNHNLKLSVMQELEIDRISQSSMALPKNTSTLRNLAKGSSIGYESLLNHHTAPFATMLGTVLIGLGIMSYLNG